MPAHERSSRTNSAACVQSPSRPLRRSSASHPAHIIQRAQAMPQSLTAADVLQLQRTIGNQATIRLLSGLPGGLEGSPSTGSPTETVQRQTDDDGSKPTLTPVTGAEYRGRLQNPGPEPSPVSPIDWAEKRREHHFDQTKYEKDLAEFRRRVAQIPHLANNTVFVGAVEEYAQALRTYNEERARYYLTRILDTLDQMKAFKIEQQFYSNMNANEDELSDYARESKTKGQLWSKLEPYLSIQEAQAHKGVSLEGSLAGTLFNGLSFGYVYKTGNILQAQWTEVSRRFVSRLRGEVHVRVFGGIAQGSVFTETEWPLLQQLMQQARKRGGTKVTKVVIHLYIPKDDLVKAHDSKDDTKAKKKPIPELNVRNEQQFRHETIELTSTEGLTEGLKKVPQFDKRYWLLQNKHREDEEARYATPQSIQSLQERVEQLNRAGLISKFIPLPKDK